MNFFKRLFGGTGAESETGAETPVRMLTGEWRGHYEQYGSQRRIIAKITQEENRISGVMTDVDNIAEESLRDALAKSGLPLETGEEIANQIARLLPDARKGPITSRTILPESSVLVGTVSGEFVQFTKTYQGEAFHSYEVGGKEVSGARKGHSVEYEGRLSEDAKTIVGEWTIYQPELPNGYIEGTFVLEKRNA